MPYLVNGQAVSEELIRQESERIGRDLRWKTIPDEAERARRLRAAAEYSAIDRVLVEQAAANDPRPIDASAFEQALEAAEIDRRLPRSIFDDSLLRRGDRAASSGCSAPRSEMAAGAAKATAEEVEAFYKANGENFRGSELFHAAHIVKHVNGEQGEEQARAGIEAALAELERGAPFSEVAEKHSDCKGKGGDLGRFSAGEMVQEFEDAIRALEPEQRTGIFRTPFGFHIAELRAKTAAGPASFEEVRADIERVLTLQNQHRAYLRAVAELRSRAQIRLVPAEQAAAN